MSFFDLHNRYEECNNESRKKVRPEKSSSSEKVELFSGRTFFQETNLNYFLYNSCVICDTGTSDLSLESSFEWEKMAQEVEEGGVQLNIEYKDSLNFPPYIHNINPIHPQTFGHFFKLTQL